MSQFQLHLFTCELRSPSLAVLQISCTLPPTDGQGMPVLELRCGAVRVQGLFEADSTNLL